MRTDADSNIFYCLAVLLGRVAESHALSEQSSTNMQTIFGEMPHGEMESAMSICHETSHVTKPLVSDVMCILH